VEGGVVVREGVVGLEEADHMGIDIGIKTIKIDIGIGIGIKIDMDIGIDIGIKRDIKTI
jgi:hypothetical protein